MQQWFSFLPFEIQWPYVVVLVLLIWAGFVYNRLVQLRNDWRNAWSQIDVQLKRRHDLIPNLLETVKAYAAHERQTLEAVMQARNGAEQLRQAAQSNPGLASLGQLGQAEGLLGGALGRLYAVSENYPDLKADSQFTELRQSLEGTENRIGFARQAYNDAVTVYRVRRESMPDLLVARLLGFADQALWQITNDEERLAPKIKF